jgi:hypothetical protein
MKTKEQYLRLIESQWNAAAANWDVDALSDIYVEDAVLFGGLPELSVGKIAIRDYFSTYIGTLKSVKMAMVDQRLLEVETQTCVAQGFVDFNFYLCDGKTISTKMRTTWVITVREGEPKLLAHHFSNIPLTPPTT